MGDKCFTPMQAVIITIMMAVHAGFTKEEIMESDMWKSHETPELIELLNTLYEARDEFSIKRSRSLDSINVSLQLPSETE